MTQREARVLFTKLLVELLSWAINFGLHDDEEIAFGEGLVALTDARDGDHDGPHKKDGGHYSGTAIDLVLYRKSKPVTNGDDPTWRALQAKWRSMNLLCKTVQGDANHFGIVFQGRV